MTVPGRASATLDEQVALAEAVRQAALAVPGVAGMSPGVGYIEATYGRNVEVVGVGISTHDGRVAAKVHLIVDVTPMRPLAKRVRAAIRTTIQCLSDLPIGPIDLYIDDIRLDAVPPAQESPS